MERSFDGCRAALLGAFIHCCRRADSLQEMRGAELEPNDKAILTVEKMHVSTVKFRGFLREIQARTGSW